MQSRRVQSVICGMAVGWLVGLSLSPVLHIVLGSVVTLVVTVANTASGLVALKGRRLGFNPSFVMWLTLGIAVGATLGIMARTNGVFGPNPRYISWRWSIDKVHQDEFRRELFTSVYLQTKPSGEHKGADSKEPDRRTGHSPYTGGLFASLTSSQLDELEVAGIVEASSIMQTMENGKYKQFILQLNSNQIDSLRSLICDEAKSAKK